MISQPAARFGALVLIVVILAVTTACSTQKAVVGAPSTGDRQLAGRAQVPTVGERAAAVALRQVGAPYRYGGSSPEGFDCSGLVHYSYARAGKPIPRTTAALWNSTSPVQSQRIRPGDLLFFNIAGKMAHVGLYLGNRQFVHAPSTGRSVTIENLDNNYYSRALIRAGRP